MSKRKWPKTRRWRTRWNPGRRVGDETATKDGADRVARQAVGPNAMWTHAHKSAAAAMWCRAVARTLDAGDVFWSHDTPIYWAGTEHNFREAMRQLGRNADSAVRTVNKIACGEWTVATTEKPGTTVVRDDTGKLLQFTTVSDVAACVANARKKNPHGKLFITKRVTRTTRIGKPQSKAPWPPSETE